MGKSFAQNLRYFCMKRNEFCGNIFCESCARNEILFLRNCYFFAQKLCAKKEKFCVSFRKNCAKVLRMETLEETDVLFK